MDLKSRILRKLPKIDPTKLTDYMYIEHLGELKLGRYIRWVNESDFTKLMRGGFVVSVEIEDNGIFILCKNGNNDLFTIIYDECFIFQKLSVQEMIISEAMSFE